LATPAPRKQKKKSAAARASRRVSISGVRISPEERVSLYAQARYLPWEFKQKSGLLLPFTTYFQDPFVAKEHPEQAFDPNTYVAWEPGLTDGPTMPSRPRPCAAWPITYGR
jgi:hypothetical protein